MADHKRKLDENGDVSNKRTAVNPSETETAMIQVQNQQLRAKVEGMRQELERLQKFVEVGRVQRDTFANHFSFIQRSMETAFNDMRASVQCLHSKEIDTFLDSDKAHQTLSTFLKKVLSHPEDSEVEIESLWKSATQPLRELSHLIITFGQKHASDVVSQLESIHQKSNDTALVDQCKVLLVNLQKTLVQQEKSRVSDQAQRQLRDALVIRDDKIQTLSSEISNLQEDLTVAESRISKLKSQLKEANLTLSQVDLSQSQTPVIPENKNETNMMNHAEADEELKTRILDLEADIASSELGNQANLKRITMLESERETLSEQVNELRVQCELSEDRVPLTRTYKTLSQTTSNIKHVLDERAKDFSKLSEELILHKRVLESEKAQMEEDYAKECHALQETLVERNKQLSTYRTKLDNLRFKYEQTKSAPKDAEKRLLDLNNMLNTQQMEIRRLRKSHEQNQSHLTPLKFETKDEQLVALQNQIEAATQENEDLMGEFDETARAYEELQEQNIRLLSQLREKEEANSLLLGDRLKSTHQNTLKEKDLAVLEAKIQNGEKLIAEQKNTIQALQTNLSASRKRVTELDETLVSIESKLVECKHLWAISDQEKKEVEALVRKQTDTAQSYAQSQKELNTKYNTAESEKHKLSVQVSQLKERLSRYKKRTDLGDTSLYEEIESTKQQLRCPVCNTEKRNCAITKCGHTFCYTCTRKNLDTRHRKCPGCGIQFAESDVLAIYF